MKKRTIINELLLLELNIIKDIELGNIY